MRGLTYGSVCSGIEAATAAWHGLGWRPAFFSEVDAFPSAVLAHHHPEVPNHGDMQGLQPEAGSINLLVGGTPCQSFSVAGLRRGLADARGNLALVFLRLVDAARPDWVVWENVPGVLSSNGGRDFGAFLGGLGQLGYGWAYRVLDAQYFGVPQRRRRVFVVASARGWAPAVAVLLEREGLRRNPPQGVGAGEDAAPGADSGTGGGGWAPSLARCVTAGEGRRQDGDTETFIAHTLRGEGFDASEDGTGRGTPLVPARLFRETGQGWWTEGLAGLRAEPGGMPENVVAFHHTQDPISGPVSPALGCTADGMGDAHAVGAGVAVRRLTPRECERLQGFPDDYTAVPYRGRLAADGPRYKALGNSMAVPVMRWLGRRIAAVESALLEAA